MLREDLQHRITTTMPAAQRTFDVSPPLLGSACDYLTQLQEPLEVDVGVLCLVRPCESIIEDEWLVQQRECSVGCLGPS